MPNHEALDRPDILMFLFHPRPEWETPQAGGPARDIMIPVDDAVAVGARFHLFDAAAPNLLFFHGNGEIVSDYDALSTFYKEIGLNFLPVDYRGYGRSSGEPSVTAMMQDAHTIFDFTRKWLRENGYRGPLLVMGRSLGSASAIEIAAAHADRLAGLIIESGFAHTLPLLQRLGARVDALSTVKDMPPDNIDKIKTIDIPLLVIHAAHDQIIPYSDGEALHDASPSTRKTMIQIPMADHNSLFQYGLERYFTSIQRFVQDIL